MLDIVVAEVLNTDGTVYDRCFNWESGATYASDGYEVVAVADDGGVTTEAAQHIYDTRLADFQDAYGVGVTNQ